MDKIDKLISMLDGREIGEEVSKEAFEFAKVNDLVIIYGASDDLAEISGAIYDEVSLWKGGLIYFDEDDLFRTECEDERCPHEIRRQERCKTVEAIFGGEGPTWTYKTDIPHKKFNIYEDKDIYCQGIVFHIDELKQ